MMKKKVLSVLLAAGLALVGLTACTGDIEEEIDPNKTQIYVSVFNGGYGIDWAYEIKEQFEADHPEYQVMIEPTLDSDLFAGATSLNYNVYFTTTKPTFKSIAANDLFADLSDIYDATLPGESAPVKDKVQNYDIVKEALGYPGKDGIFAMPYTQSIAGLVYDHDIFEDNIDKGWLWTADVSEKSAVEADGITCEVQGDRLIFKSATVDTHYDEGDVILRDGKDDVYGTYDDGQPETIEEWNQLCSLIKMNADRLAKPITFTDMHGYEYTLPVLNAMFIQYDGLDNYQLFHDYQGTYTNGNVTFPVTLQDGYKVYDMVGLQKAFQFYYENICSTNNNEVVKDSDHLAAQSRFLLYHEISKQEYAAPMLVEGVWWENEARPTFEDLSAQDSSYEYGKRDFRYMLLPKLDDGQIGIPGNPDGSVMVAQDCGLILVADKDGEDVVNMSKEFVKYTLKDENLAYFTQTTGVPRPYKYEMTDEQLASMTKFGRTAYEMVQDTENIAVVSPFLYSARSPLSFSTELGTWSFVTNIQEEAGMAKYSYPIEMRSRVSDVQTYINGMKDYYSKNWAAFYETAKPLYDLTASA